MWTHWTHSPNGTYLICNRGTEYFGTEFPMISGGVLSSLFSGFHPPGLLTPTTERRKEARTKSIEKISKLLYPISDWILDQECRTIVVHPGGYFQAFPIWSVGKLSDATEQERIRYFQVPSRVLSQNRRRPQLRHSQTLSIQEATSVPGQQELSFAAEECKWLREEIPSDWICSFISGPPGSLIDAGIDNAFVHFAGHSIAHQNPLESALLTYAGHLTVSQIVKNSSNALLVFLGSCESGLPMNFQLQDEYLSIQSAFWYSRAQYTIGTLWPVGDEVAMAFAKEFYSTCSLKLLTTPLWWVFPSIEAG